MYVIIGDEGRHGNEYNSTYEKRKLREIVARVRENDEMKSKFFTSQATRHNMKESTPTGSKIRKIGPLILAFLISFTEASTTSTSKSTPLVSNPTTKHLNPIDLSYQYHHDKATLLPKFLKDFETSFANNNTGPCSMEIDFSSSVLLDGGASTIFQKLREHQQNHTSTATIQDNENVLLLHLCMKMNGITATGAFHIFRELLELNSNGKAADILRTSDATNNTNVTLLEDSTTKNIINGNSSVTPTLDKIDEGISTNLTNSSDMEVNSAVLQNEILPNTTSLPNSNETKITEEAQRSSNNGIMRTRIDSLDMAFNDLSQKKESKIMNGALRKLIESYDACPRSLKLDQCGLGAPTCRSIAKGIIKRCHTIYESTKNQSEINEFEYRNNLSLFLSGNPSIGDAGAAAIVAALHIVNQEHPLSRPILDTLDLSSCGISDTGAEALAVALESSPGCVRRLILSNNRISDKGICAICDALISNGHYDSRSDSSEKPSSSQLEYLNLDNNKDISDRGASAIANAMECGTLLSISLRSCSIAADGALAFGKVLPKLAFLNTKSAETRIQTHIDLSGNQLGIYRPPKKKKGASLLKSKASATTASYFNFIGKKIKGGLKDVTGVDVSQYISAASAESDDDFEDSSEYLDKASKERKSMDEIVTSSKCGARAFADYLINSEGEKSNSVLSSISKSKIGMRFCSLDKGGVDALAALVIQAKEKLGLELNIDISMNSAIDASDVIAFDDDGDNERLKEMAQRHLDALEALLLAQERAAEASMEYNSWKYESEYGDGSSDDVGDFGYDNGYDSFEEQEDNDFYDVDFSYD